jgi:hypothetical protein
MADDRSRGFIRPLIEVGPALAFQGVAQLGEWIREEARVAWLWVRFHRG